MSEAATLSIRTVAAAHRSARARKALFDVLGDGFLYRHNPVFRSIRDEALRRGFRFQRDTSGHLSVDRLLRLQQMLRSKVIPFHASARPVLALAGGPMARMPFVHAPLQFPDRLMHEASHGIADDILRLQRLAPGRRRAHAFIARVELGESFANAIEATAGTFCEPGPYAAFFANSINLVPKPGFNRGFQAIAEHVDAPTALRFAIACYFMINALQHEVTDAELHACLARVATRVPRVALRRELRGMFAATSQLSLGFRTRTVDFYLRYVSGGRYHLRHLRELRAIELLQRRDVGEALWSLSAVLDGAW
jgi:hypothetical protein